MHCGGPLGSGLLARMQQAAAAEAEPDMLPAHPEELAEADESAARARGRNVLWVITAVLLLAGSLLRNCQ